MFKTPPPLGLAPMEGVTDFPMRLWMYLIGEPDFLCTPFLRVTHCFPAKALPETFIPELGHKAFPSTPYEIIPQLMASSAQDFLRVAQPFVAEGIWDSVDINCGCPSPKTVGHGAGSSLLEEPDYFSQFIKEIVQALGPYKLGVKMRLGYHQPEEFPGLLALIKDLPLKRLTIHTRTRADGYKGKARYEWIDHQREIFESKTRPYDLMLSGDIVDKQSYAALINTYPYANAWISGRGALRYPTLFKDIRNGWNDHAEGPPAFSKDSFFALIQCLYYVHELWQLDTQQLIAYAGDLFTDLPKQRTNSSFWMIQAAELKTLCQAAASKSLNAANQINWTSVIGATGSSNNSHKEKRLYALSRLKQFWGSLRTGLPEAYFAPLLFRSKTFDDFMQGLEVILANDPHPHVSFSYQPEYDWMFNGSKKN